MGWGRRTAAWLIPLALIVIGLFWPLVFTGTSQARSASSLGAHSASQSSCSSATAPNSVAQRSAAEKQLDTAVGQVLALGNMYPDLKSSANFLDLQQNLANSEDKLAFARQYYNDAAATCNRVMTTIPRMFMAGAGGVSRREYYKVPQ